MIKVTVTFENKDKDAEDTIVQAKFGDFDDIPVWLEKIKHLNEDDTLKKEIGFFAKHKKGDA
jgi:hypothetical protein